MKQRSKEAKEIILASFRLCETFFEHSKPEALFKEL